MIDKPLMKALALTQISNAVPANTLAHKQWCVRAVLKASLAAANQDSGSLKLK